jgi:phthalate 4,5-cis-dihydrodiol dehydrogenase
VPSSVTRVECLRGVEQCTTPGLFFSISHSNIAAFAIDVQKPEPAVSPPIRIGVAGLGRAFTLMLPTFTADPRVRLVAGADPLPAARDRFARDFGAPAFDDVERLCAQDGVDVIYVATPHQFHARHTALAFADGKHVLLEKPMAITLDDCTAMIEAGMRAGRHLIVGHSHSFNRPVARVRELCERGDFGDVRMITAINFTDFLYRPRRAEELATESGGGVIFSQGAHQIDIVRLVGGGRLVSVRAFTGAWDSTRPTEGAYSALLAFENGAFAHATYSGYAHYDSDELMEGIGEMGQPKSPADYGAARKRLDNAADLAAEARLKAARNYGGAMYTPPPSATPKAWNHFGFLVVCCDRADLRPTAQGVAIYADRERTFEALPPPAIPRVEVIDELYRAVVEGEPPVHDGAWARATLEACLAILTSTRKHRDVELKLQVATDRYRR